LADFQESYQELKSEQIKVIAASVDPIEKAKELVDKLGISYPVGYGMNAEEVSRMTHRTFRRKRCAEALKVL